MIENLTLSLDGIEAGETYKNCVFTSATENRYFSDVSFEGCEFQDQMLKRGEWLDCQFFNMVLSNKDFSDSIFYRCSFERCQLLGTNFSSNRWKETKVVDSRGDYLSFSDSLMEKVIFEKVSLKEAFFQQLIVKKGLVFDECELDQADFMDTPLKTVDFSKSEFEQLFFSPQLMKGVTISYNQAAQMMAMQGACIR